LRAQQTGEIGLLRPKTGNSKGISVSDFRKADELNLFKRRIDLVKYAASIGFTVNKRKSWSGSTAMNRGTERIIVTRLKKTGHYVYWSPFDEKDHGTIIDFVQKRQGLDLSGARKELRPWL
jgi:curli biogenesis system outer membrane secretion channel CsgG